MRRNLAKIIATIGPASLDSEVVANMIRAGAEAFRINMSYGDLAIWDKMVEVVMEAERKLGQQVALIADLEGPRIRLGDFQPVQLKAGESVVFSFDPSEGIPLPHREFFETISEGDQVLIGDGKISLVVEEAAGLRAKLKVIRDGVLEARKGVVISGKEIDVHAVTAKDRAALEYVVTRPFSHVMVSYTRSPEQIELVRSILADHDRRDIRVFAKIETPTGVRRAKEIAQAADGLVVARGDLGMHFSLEEIPLIQKDLVYTARLQYKPAVLATEFLASMVEKHSPTRSEIVDIFEAVRLAVDSLMLTGETAVGKNPVKVVQWMYRVIVKAQQDINPERPPATTQIYRLARGLVELVENLNTTLVVYSKSGRFAERASSFRPLKRYYVGVPDERVARAVRLLWASEPVVVGDHEYEEGLRRTSNLIEEEGLVTAGETLVEAAWSSKRGIYTIRVKNVLGPS
ncbi:MAG: pyruvate kinase [Acidilobaceae archaeon]|nr:pyruvate kinase [Acidilobaceae archaeon]MDW7973835.1 pyruvate kinase [Sulfolobales archaeon]